MSGAGIPDEVAAFIAKHVDSVVQLEGLLLLAADSGRDWSADEVARELRIETSWAEAQLDLLSGQALLERAGGRFRYAPRDAGTHAAIAGLAKAYAERRVTVISLIFAKPADNLRAFSEAFRLRKDRDGRGG